MIGRIDSSETMLRQFVCCGQDDAVVLCKLFHFDIRRLFGSEIAKVSFSSKFCSNFNLDFKSMNIDLVNTGLATCSVIEIHHCPVSHLLKGIF